SDMGGIPELIEEGKTGYIFKARDVDDLAEKILLIFENPQLYVKMRINSRKIAEERFDLRESAKKIESIILQNI
ncbi:MAG TPA: glycosyltransferase, partial [Nitrospirae bacterium]|nr:glycosyltransferase [Nitrospirota bacterium]